MVLELELEGSSELYPSRELPPDLTAMSDMPTYPTRWEADVVLADGGTVHVRPLRRDDKDALAGLHSRLSDESIYRRFFSPRPKLSPKQLDELTDMDYDRRFALIAELGGEIVAVARYVRGADDQAEVAFTVQDDQQGRGLGTV